MIVRRVMLLGAALLASAHWAPTAVATLCAPTIPAREYAEASIVFAGLPLSVQRLPREDPGRVQEQSFLVTFLVTTVWKGVVGDSIVLRTITDRYEPGQLYLYYIHASSQGFAHQHARYFGQRPFFISPCSRGERADYALWDRYWLPDPVDLRAGPKPSRATLAELLGALASPDWRMRYNASEALGSIVEARSEILTALRRMLLGKEPGDPVSVARAVGLMREAGRPAEPELAWALSNSAGEGRAAALSALENVAPADSFRRHVVLALSDTSAALLARACEIAGGWRLGERRVLELVRHPEPSVRAKAVIAIGHFRSAGRTILGTIDSLRKHDPDGYVRFAARGTWGNLTGLDPWEGLPRGSRGAGDSSRPSRRAPARP